MAAYEQNDISEARLAHSVKKILAAKFDAGLNRYEPIETDGLINDLNQDVNAQLYDEAIKNAITLVKNEGQLVPMKNNTPEKIGFLKLGDDSAELFLESLKLKGDITDISNLSAKKLSVELSKYDRIIIGYHRKNSRITSAISKKDKKTIENISKKHKTILSVFASQYSLKETDLEAVETVLISYENSEIANKATAEIIFGELGVNGTLPASISKEYPVRLGINIAQ
jgi:beta-glucosidase-like glycosyl hydrolase